MTNYEYAVGLRQLAEWYEGHPDAEQPYQSDEIRFIPENRGILAQVIRDFGGRWTKEASSGLMYFNSTFGPFTLRMYTNQSMVCEARVVGTKIIPARPAEPERVEDVLKWDCQSIMGVTDSTDSPQEP